MDDIGSNFLCYSSDGIALGYLVGQGSYGPNVIEVENAAQASFFKDPDGRRILYTMTTGDARILEIVRNFILFLFFVSKIQFCVEWSIWG